MGKRLSLHNPDVFNLTLQDLKKSYYKRAKELHPDTANQRGLPELLMAERFKRLSESYTFLLEYWQNRDFSSSIKQNTTKKKTYTPSSPTAKQNTQDNVKRYYTGPMPQVEMRFAQFLYYSKKIDWNTFIHSLTWQWKHRPRLGELAIQKGFLSHPDVLTVLRHSLPGELFGKAAVRLGFLSEKELFLLLGHQQLLKKPIGLFFTQECYFHQTEIEKQLLQMKLYNSEIRMKKNKKKI